MTTVTAAALPLPSRLVMDDQPQAWLALEASLRQHLQAQTVSATPVVLDLAPLQQFDSSALSLLLQTQRWCQQQQRQLLLLNAAPRLQELARVYGLQQLLWP
ncbi:STAS domain-containing protein [Roseateles sp. BYS180W]|uniref:STAS domain-containing protein n=1 Tax=Roseateles rivi TaxID=3299028 RepID=A0ABW7FRI0_9BURK